MSENISLKIGILGTRGIPNRYGGFEQCAEYLAAGLVAKGHRVWVYNSHNHEYQGKEWNGVTIIHCYDPEHKIGTPGQFIYDLNCIYDARKRDYDVLLQLGYTSNSIWFRLWPGYCSNVVNMDGLEWKRSKYSRQTRKFLRLAEKWAAKTGDVLIADSTGIQQHLRDTYDKDSFFIPYGAEIFTAQQPDAIGRYGVQPFGYDMLISRMEPENNIEMIIRGHVTSGTDKPLLVIGNTSNNFGTYLLQNYGNPPNVLFLDASYEAEIINNLRYYSRLYFHGHSVGGTNPSLLEAMGCNALIAAHDNTFNRAVLGEDAFYFSTENELADMVRNFTSKPVYEQKLKNNIGKIRTQYNWQKIVDDYEAVLQEASKRKRGL